MLGFSFRVPIGALLATAAVAAAPSGAAGAEGALTPQTILEWRAEGLDDPAIIHRIEEADSVVHADVAAILDLKRAGVADEVLQAFFRRSVHETHLGAEAEARVAGDETPYLGAWGHGTWYGGGWGWWGGRYRRPWEHWRWGHRPWTPYWRPWGHGHWRDPDSWMHGPWGRGYRDRDWHGSLWFGWRW
jgi:hypothetical protein